MPERYKPRMTDKNVERHARHGKNDDLGGRRNRKPNRLQRERERHQSHGGDQKGFASCKHDVWLLKTLDALAEESARSEQQNQQHQ